MLDQLADIMCIASAVAIIVIMYGRGRPTEVTDRGRQFIFIGVGMLIAFSSMHLVNATPPRPISGLVGEPAANVILSRGGGVLAGYLFIAWGLILSLPKALGDVQRQSLNGQIVEARQEYHSVNALLGSLLKSSLTGVIVADAVRDEHRDIVDFRCRMMNGAAEQILGRSASSLIGQRLFEHIPCLESTSVAREVRSVIATALPFKDEWLCENGPEPHWYQVAATKIGDGVTVTFADISDRKESEEKLKHAALHDVLTGLPNRAMFIDRLGRAIKCTRHFSDHEFAVLFLDFDRFKLVNDSLGHEAGDQLLLNIAARLREVLGGIDPPMTKGAEHVAARLGGDEFVVLLDGVSAEADVLRLADKLQEVLAEPHMLEGNEVVSTASIGIVLSKGRYDRADDVIRDADAAMYRAKTSGKARNVVFDPAMKQDESNRLVLERELRAALDRMDFELRYEPIIDLEAGRIAGLESLVRWVHPERGLVPAADFLEIAEDVGLIVPIGHWGLGEACTHLERWRKSFPAAASVSLHVNLSRPELVHAGLLDTVRAALEKSGLDPAHLRFELDERMILEHFDEVSEAIGALGALGAGIVLDDFGAGPSSLRLINRLPINLLKLDRSFLAATTENPDDVAVIGAIIKLAHSLDMTVVAKGVESREQLDMLRSLGCDHGQGHLFREPVTLPDVEAMLGTDEPFSLAA